ncbi:MAG: YrdB family protein [Anaerolineae bacterium]|nr:YrdB family protein [Anaerolineae bacterium]
MKSLNLALRFLLELCILAALAYWGFQTGDGLPARLALGLGAPLLAAVVWGLFVAPASRRRVPLPWRLLLELAIFGSAVAALAAAGQPTLGWFFGLLVVVNTVLMLLWKQ